MSLIKIGTAELTGAALDWAVAQAVGLKVITDPNSPRQRQMVEDNEAVNGWYCYSPSTDWSQGGPLIDDHDVWLSDYDGACVASCEPHFGRFIQEGNTNLIAICRAVVATKLGEKVEVPQELISSQG